MTAPPTAPRNMSVAAWRKAAVKEHDFQAAVLEHLRVRARRDCYWFAIPNAGKRSLSQAAIMKREGLTAGVFDLCIMLPGGRAHWLELKTPRGRMSEAQKAFLMICIALKHPAAIVHSVDDALTQLREWKVIDD